MSNALQYTLQGGKIIVSAKPKEDKMIIEVKDTGKGMSKEILENYLLRGAGIGLLLVKGFLEKSGGEIWVESLGGEGSSFYFTLPIEKIFDKIDNASKIELS